MDILQIMQNPLTQSGNTGNYLRLVLSEAAHYGMPPGVIAMLDDVGAMLGFYDPLPAGPAAHLAGPMVTWRTDRRQPTIDNINDVEAMALKQRALVAFGGAEAGHMVGTAEIVAALGNTHREAMPVPYYEVWTWAATDVHAQIGRKPKDQVRKDHSWPLILDADVLRPGGRLNETYNEIATSIRRSAISVVRGDPANPRSYLRPLGLHFLRHHAEYLRQMAADDRPQAAALERSIAAIRGMFPDITEAEINAPDAA